MVTTVSLSSTQLGEISSVHPDFPIMIAKSLRTPYAKEESGANLVIV
jgi:hypothetical protein